MPTYKTSILVSNILDPLTHEEQDLCQVYQKLSQEQRYASIETRLIKDASMKAICEQSLQGKEFTYWVTGELQRAGLNLSSMQEVQRLAAVDKVKEMMKQASSIPCSWIGIASGKIETTVEEGIQAFAASVAALWKEIKQREYPFRILIEPLDEFAHKCNVLGQTSTVISFMELLPAEALHEKQICLCWDSAHMALNEDSFASSIQQLAPYIVRVHFANAVLDKESKLYGDHHLGFCKEGFLNLNSAKEIKKLMDAYLQGEITVAVEIRETNRDHAWQLEEESYQFLMQVLQ